MCNLWSNTLFHIPNPCCCCKLRCGATWAACIDFLYGGISLFVPITLGAGFSELEKDLKPDFGSLYNYFKNDIMQTFVTYGCNGIQSSTGLYLVIAIKCFRNPVYKFIAGCLWLLGRAIITITWVPYVYAILGERSSVKNSPTWQKYAYLLIFNLALHVYFFLVIRFYTMEAYDTWKYRPIQPETSNSNKRGGRLRPKISSTKKKHHPTTHKEKLAEERKLRRQANIEHPPQSYFIRPRHKWEDAPVWRVRDEDIFYGENYTHWDPTKFYHQFERLQNTGILKLGEKDVFDEHEYLKHIDIDGADSMQIIDSVEIIDEASQPSVKQSKSSIQSHLSRSRSHISFKNPSATALPSHEPREGKSEPLHSALMLKKSKQ